MRSADKQFAKAIQAIQQNHNMSRREFAKRLRVGYSTLTMIYGHRRNVGQKVLTALLREFPESKPAIDIFLLGKAAIVPSDIQL